MPERFLLRTSPSPRVTLEEFEGVMRYVFEPYFIMFQTKISDVSFPTSLNSFSLETNEQPIPVTGSRDHKALPYIRAKWLEFNFKVVKTTFSSSILPCKSNHYLPSAVFGHSHHRSLPRRSFKGSRISSLPTNMNLVGTM